MKKVELSKGKKLEKKTIKNYFRRYVRLYGTKTMYRISL